MNNLKFTRNQLYDLVWSKSITTLAKEFACSGNGLRKICIKHNIPLPKSGYWSKIKFNKKVTKEILQKGNDSLKIELYIRKKGQKSINHPNSERAKIRQEIENNMELSLIVPSKLSKPHKYIIATKNYHEKLKIRNKKKDWNLQLDATNVLSINVSDKLYSRAYRFMDTLIKILEKRGYVLNVSGKTEVTIKEQVYSLRLTEKNRRVKRETNTSWDSFDLVSTGNLVIKVDRTYPIKEWSDSKSRKLEDKLIDILTWLELRAKQDKEQQIASELWNKQYQAQRQRETDLQQQKDNELGRFKELFSSATRYHKTIYIRNYIDKFESFAIESDGLDEEKKKWIKWARDKADWFDPFIENEDELLKGIDRDKM